MHRIAQFRVSGHWFLDRDATEQARHRGWRSLDGFMDAVVLFERHKRLPLHGVDKQHGMDTVNDLIGSMDRQLESLESRTRSEGHDRRSHPPVVGTTGVERVIVWVIPEGWFVAPGLAFSTAVVDGLWMGPGVVQSFAQLGHVDTTPVRQLHHVLVTDQVVGVLGHRGQRAVRPPGPAPRAW